MATKLNANAEKRLKALNINAKSEEDAQEKLLEVLVENGIEGMDEEELDTLLDIAESFSDELSSNKDGDSEEDENDELAKEAEAEEEEEPEEDEEEDYFADMNRSDLKFYIKEKGIGITVKKSMTDDDLRSMLKEWVSAELLKDSRPSSKDLKKSTPSKSEKPAAKVAEKPAAKPAAKKEEKKEPKQATNKRGIKLDPKNNQEDREVFEVLHDLFPEEEYVYAWVASAGVTIKHKGKNSQRSMVLIENCSKQSDDSIKCNLYLLTFTKQTEVLDEAGIEYEKCWSGAPFMKGITLDEAVEIITGLMEQIVATVKKIDKKLGDNRKKMEENLDKKAPKKVVKVKEAEEEEEEEEDEDEAPKPKKSSVAPAKKTIKKK